MNTPSPFQDLKNYLRRPADDQFASVMGGTLRTLGIPHDLPIQVAQGGAAGKPKAGKEKL